MSPPLVKLDSLPPAARAALWRKLVATAAESRHAGWLAWELSEPINATGRAFGVALSASEIASILAA
jgi:hypothetical protein